MAVGFCQSVISLLYSLLSLPLSLSQLGNHSNTSLYFYHYQTPDPHNQIGHETAAAVNGLNCVTKTSSLRPTSTKVTFIKAKTAWFETLYYESYTKKKKRQVTLYFYVKNE